MSKKREKHPELIDELERVLFPHQESEEDQESFTKEGRQRVDGWIHGLLGSAGQQMVDSDGHPCDVLAVRKLDRVELGAGYALRDPATWFVYDRRPPDLRWHKHCGPYSTFEQAVEWIQALAKDDDPQPQCKVCGMGHGQHLANCPRAIQQAGR